MDFQDILTDLNITQYDSRLEEVFHTLPAETSFCDLEALKRYEAELDLLGEYYDLAVQAAKEIMADPQLYAYGKTICQYLKTCTAREGEALTIPPLDGTLKRDMFGLMVMVTRIPACVEMYRERNFSMEEIKEYLQVIKRCMGLMEIAIGRSAVNAVYFEWDMLYLYCEIFAYGSFNFQIAEFYGKALILRDKETGETVPMMTDYSFHRSGNILGNLGAEDPEGSFESDFRETEDAFIGKCVYNGKATPEERVCLKSQWECVLRTGDPVIAVHIPRKTDLSPAAVEKSIEEGMEFAAKVYPEHHAKCLVCYSWMMDPIVGELLDDQSNVVAFANRFLRYPYECKHDAYSAFIFPGHRGGKEDLPENSTLQRKLKAHFLSGGELLYTGGVYKKHLG